MLLQQKRLCGDYPSLGYLRTAALRRELVDRRRDRVYQWSIGFWDV